MIIELYLDISPAPEPQEVAELLRQIADRIEQKGEVPGYQQLLADDDACLGVIRSSHRHLLTEVRYD